MWGRAGIIIIIPTLWMRKMKLRETLCVRNHKKQSHGLDSILMEDNALYYCSANTLISIFPLLLIICLKWKTPLMTPVSFLLHLPKTEVLLCASQHKILIGKCFPFLTFLWLVSIFIVVFNMGGKNNPETPECILNESTYGCLFLLSGN